MPLEARMAAMAPHFTVLRPEGEGPFPAVLQFHGCGGRGEALQDIWAEAFRDAGFVAIVVDSYAHRGIARLEAYASVCLGLRLRGQERAGDVFAAYAFAQAQPDIDPARIAMIGWSHGGWAVLDALAIPASALTAETGLTGLSPEPLQGLRAAVALYPYAGLGSVSAHARFRAPSPPVLAVLATADSVIGWRVHARALERQREAGADVTVLRAQGATHAFDDPKAVDLRVRYDPALARQTRTDVAAWLMARSA